MSAIKINYPSGGRSANEVFIKNVKTLREGVLVGTAKLPFASTEKPVVIYGQTLASGNIEYRTVSAQCPHQGADISRDELNDDGNVYCSLHRRPICIYSEYNQAYLTEKRGDGYVIVKS